MKPVVRCARAQLGLLTILGVLSGCQLITGVNDLRVSNEGDETNEPRKDASDTDDDSDDTDNTRTDVPDADANDSAASTGSQTSGRSSTSTRASSGSSSSAIEAGVTQGPEQDAGCRVPSQLACAPITNCGCDEGTVCTLTQVEEALTLACAAPGSVELGAACEPGTCKSGSHCWQGICRQACQRDVDCEVEGATCRELDAEGAVLSRVSYCDAPCDVLSPEAPRGELFACPVGQTCVRTATTTVCTSALGEATRGQVCERDTDCAAGLGCFEQTCKAWCNPEEDGACGEWSECQALTEVEGTEGPIGVCQSSCTISDVEGSECGILPNCGCASGQSCRVVDSSGLTQCSAIGAGAAQSACESDLDCQFDLACLVGLCRPYCSMNEPECPEVANCYQLEDANGSPIEGLGLCGGSCDPVHASTDNDLVTPCGSGGVCQPGFFDDGFVAPYCFPTYGEELVPHGQACDGEDDMCAPGGVCTDRCERLCREHADCAGLTETAECLASALGHLDADGSELGFCCLGNAIEGSECGVFGDDCGCPEGEACRMALDNEDFYYLDGRTACSPAGQVEAQEECEIDADCVRGTSCVDGLCREHCSGQCSPTSGTCGQISVEETDIPGALVCLGLCDPRAPEEATDEWDGCGSGVKCVPGKASDADNQLSHCVVSTGDVEVGGECDRYQDCQAGLACICADDECTVGTCHKWCWSTEDCDEGTVCLEVDGQIKPGFGLGYCSE